MAGMEWEPEEELRRESEASFSRTVALGTVTSVTG